MSNAFVEQTIHDFFRSPTVDCYLAAKRAACDSREYEPSARDLVALETSVARVKESQSLTSRHGSSARFSNVAAAQQMIEADLHDLPSTYRLCPRWHYLAGRVAEWHGDQASVRSSVQKMQLCLRAIAESGDGTKESPYQITFLTDADDLIRAFGESVRHQQLVSSPDGYRDVVTAHSGIEFWFDVEVLLERTSQKAAFAHVDR